MIADRTAAGPRAAPIIVALAATLVALALVALAVLPTGADEPGDVVATGERLAATAVVDDARVLLVSRAPDLALTIAYRGPKGWLGADLPPAPADAVATWVSTAGDGPVPALAAVYGRAPGNAVEIRWDDGEVTRPEVASDGLFVSARPGQHRADHVTMVGPDGETIMVVDDL